MGENTIGLATSLLCTCKVNENDKKRKVHKFNLHEPSKTTHSTGKDGRYEAATWYAINHTFVMGMQLIGRGGSESVKLLGLMDLPYQGWEKKRFRKVEEELGFMERLVCENSIEEVLKREIKDTLENKEKGSYARYLALSDEEKEMHDNKPHITVNYDMGWIKSGSGGRYDSKSGHAFMFGGTNKEIIGMVLYTKGCRKCAVAEKRGVMSIAHSCAKNFEGSSKSMEAEAILQMVVDAFNNRGFIVSVIVSDDDSTMKACLKHRKLKADGKQYKSDKGRLDVHIPEPLFLADPSHRVKVVAKAFFLMLKKKVKERFGLTKADCLRLKVNWGYMLKQNRGKTLQELKK